MVKASTKRRPTAKRAAAKTADLLKDIRRIEATDLDWSKPSEPAPVVEPDIVSRSSEAPSGRQPFGAWLVQQEKRGGYIGDLAKVAKGDPRFPKRGDPDAVRKHLSDMGADGDAHAALDDAELDWLAL